MVKKTILAAFLLFTLLVMLFPVPLFLACSRWQVENFFLKTFGAEVAFENIELKEGIIHFNSGRVTKNGELLALFDASYKPKISLKKKEIGGKILVEHLKILKSIKRKGPFPSFHSPVETFFSLNLKTCVTKGELIVFDTDPQQTLAKASFDLTHYFFEDHSFGEIAFYSDLPAGKLSSFFFKSGKEALEVSGEFKGEDLQKSYRLASSFFMEEGSFFNWDIAGGKINGNLSIRFEKNKPTTLSTNLQFSNIKGENKKLNLVGELERLRADLAIDFSTLSGFNGDFLVQGGKLAFWDKAVIGQKLWDLNELYSKLSIKNGKVQTSTLNADFLGLKGKLLLDLESDPALHMQVKGKSSEIHAVFPEGLRKGICEALPEDDIELLATVKKGKAGLELEGSLDVKEAFVTQTHFDFGCHFGTLSSDQEEETVPFKISHFFNQIKDQFCLHAKRLGWFRAKNVSAKKFFSPFLFKDLNLDLFGSVDLDGTFDEKYLVLFYEGKDFLLQSPSFDLSFDRIEKQDEGTPAVHCINLENFSHTGFLPLKDATYFQKHAGVVFKDAGGLVQFEDHKIKVKEIKTSWQDVTFRGNIDIQINSLKDIDVELSSHQFAGPLEKAKELASHFVHSKVWKMPVEEGIVEGFFNFRYHFSSKAELKEGMVRGKIADCLLDKKLFCIKNATAEFEYDYQKNCLFFNECTGLLALPQLKRELSFSSSHIKLSDFPHFQFDFAFNLLENEKAVFSTIGFSSEKEGGREISLLSSDGELFAFQQNGKVKITNFKWGDIQGEALVNLDGNLAKIERLFCKKGQGKEILFCGEFDFKESCLTGKLEKIDFDLQEAFKKASVFKPSGQLAASGNLMWQVGKHLEVSALVSYQALNIGTLSFGSGHGLKCSYSTDAGLEIEGLEVQIPSPEVLHKYHLGKVCYNFHERKIQLEGCEFSLSDEKLDAALKSVERLFPEKIPSSVLDVLKEAKKGELLEGKISLEIYPDNIWIYLYLKDGNYHIRGHQIELKNLALICDPKEMHIWTDYHYKNLKGELHFLADSLSFSHGKLKLFDKNGSHDEKSGLFINWSRKKESGFYLEDIEGCFAGLTFALKGSQERSKDDALYMTGKVGCELEQTRSFLEGALQKTLNSYALSGTYFLEGEFGFNKKEKGLYCSGNLTGREVSCAGIKLNDLSSTIFYQKNYLAFSNFNIKDVALKMSCKYMHLNKRQGDWEMSLEEAKLQDVRFSKLRCSWLKKDPRKKTFFRSFVIPSFSLNFLKGIVGKQESVQGSGQFEFTKLPKRSLLTSLLLLPTEITARIGLDLSALVPVRGTILYEIKDKKMNVLELKDVFSEGKKSKFYLAEQTPAWIDFSGNLNMKIKMKQYNLLMKLAEFFTISVKGSLLKPAYSLSNFIDDEDSL